MFAGTIALTFIFPGNSKHLFFTHLKADPIEWVDKGYFVMGQNGCDINKLASFKGSNEF